MGGLFSLVIPDLLEAMLIDDPVGAFPVHGVCGMWGVFCTWLFDSTDSVSLEAQMVGLVAIASWSWFAAFIIFLTSDWPPRLQAAATLSILKLVPTQGLGASPSAAFALPANSPAVKMAEKAAARASLCVIGRKSLASWPLA